MSQATGGDASRTTLVVVDDEELFLRALSSSLSRLHPEWRVLSTSDARSALDWLRTEDVDVLLTDLGMPNVDGLELLMDAATISPATSMVLMTGHTSNGALPDVRRRGIPVLEKPFPLGDAARIIEERLATRAGQLSGALSLSLEDLVQVLALSRREAIVRIRMGTSTGSLWFHEGTVVHASLGELVGEPAFYAILSRRGGRFAVEPYSPPPEHSIDSRWEELLMEGCRLMDEHVSGVSTAELVGIEQGDWFDDALEGSEMDPSEVVDGTETQTIQVKGTDMADIQASLEKLMSIDGATGCCVVDSNSGMMLGSLGGSAAFNLEVAAAGNTEVVRAKRKTMAALKLNDTVEDIRVSCTIRGSDGAAEGIAHRA
ncbi:MAG: DUF4388 domain-containing protein [Polyangiales bacterium]